jgi:hypothetical protein
MNFLKTIKPVPSFRDQIYIADKQLSPEFCKACIDKFESDPCIESGVTGRGHAVDTKQSDDLMISKYNRWNKEDNQVATQLSKNLNNFAVEFKNKFDWWVYKELHDTGYQIQRTHPNGFYHWHSDDAKSTRHYTFIFYLNDIKNGGYTEFIDGTRIQPKAGRFLLFPATDIYTHRGTAPKDEIKYILTGWLHREFDGDTRIKGDWHNLITAPPEKNSTFNDLPQNRFDAEDSHITLIEGEELDIEDNNVQMILE